MAVIELNNVMPGTFKIPTDLTAAGATGTRRTIRADYDFAVRGGAVSTIALVGSAAIPASSVVTEGYIEVLTPLTSGGAATIAVQVETAGDVIPATAVASWTGGVKNVTPADTSGTLTAATAFKTTVARDVSVVIATAALTAGKFSVYLTYVTEA